MVKEDHHSALSSIALLQERFRKLQKTKELRQEKQLLLKLLSESPTIRNQQQPSLNTFAVVVDPEKERTLRHNCQLSLSLGEPKDSHEITKQRDLRAPSSSSSNALGKYSSLFFNDDAEALVSCTSPVKISSTIETCSDHNHSDIDTSLRL